MFMQGDLISLLTRRTLFCRDPARDGSSRIVPMVRLEQSG
jgi:hypothetical protein